MYYPCQINDNCGKNTNYGYLFTSPVSSIYKFKYQRPKHKKIPCLVMFIFVEIYVMQ